MPGRPKKPTKSPVPPKTGKPASRARKSQRSEEVPEADLGDRVHFLESKLVEVVSDTRAILDHLSGKALLSAEDSQSPPHQNRSAPGKAKDRRQVTSRPTPYPSPQATTDQPRQEPRDDDDFTELFTAAVGGNASAATASLPVNFRDNTNPLVTAQVQSILQSTSQQISSLKGRPTHAHDYILRGPTRVKTSLACLEPAEYLFGLTRLMKDRRTPVEEKPKIVKHLNEVIADAAVYKWEQVRDWSEEVLSSISDDTFTWMDDGSIHDLRGEVSHVRTGRLYPSQAAAEASIRLKDRATPKPAPSAAQGAPAQHQSHYPNQQQRHQPQNLTRRPLPSRSSAGRSDIPCTAFNSKYGCSKQDGHVEGGIKHGHHCDWCRANLNKLHFHNFPDCLCRGPNDRQPAPFRA